jgi:hypothetical protein
VSDNSDDDINNIKSLCDQVIQVTPTFSLSLSLYLCTLKSLLWDTKSDCPSIYIYIYIYIYIDIDIDIDIISTTSNPMRPSAPQRSLLLYIVFFIRGSCRNTARSSTSTCRTHTRFFILYVVYHDIYIYIYIYISRQLSEYRVQLYEYLQNRMRAIAPNLTTMVRIYIYIYNITCVPSPPT